MIGGILVISVIIGLLLAFGIANDARKTGRNPWLWFIVVSLFGIFGVALYFYDVSRNPPSEKTILRVSGTVTKDDDEVTKMYLDVYTDDVVEANERFFARCAKEGLRVSGEPNLSLRPHPTITREANQTYRPGADRLPPKIGTWYRTTSTDNVLFVTVLLAILLYAVIGSILSILF